MIFLKKTAITLACATALGALTTAPSLAGVITPTDTTAVSTGSPVESVYHRYGWRHHRHHAWRPWRTVWVYPAYIAIPPVLNPGQQVGGVFYNWWPFGPWGWY